ncbi:uncharacterized protein PG986_008044 [Apiospora aurea]|uniref:Uncharacterized protein n=1 Tax=Apiospora aurea TaxID=335848 RepID=A0ABR1QEB2_9PEZI
MFSTDDYQAHHRHVSGARLQVQRAASSTGHFLSDLGQFVCGRASGKEESAPFEAHLGWLHRDIESEMDFRRPDPVGGEGEVEARIAQWTGSREVDASSYFKAPSSPLSVLPFSLLYHPQTALDKTRSACQPLQPYWFASLRWSSITALLPHGLRPNHNPY